MRHCRYTVDHYSAPRQRRLRHVMPFVCSLAPWAVVACIALVIGYAAGCFVGWAGQ